MKLKEVLRPYHRCSEGFVSTSSLVAVGSFRAPTCSGATGQAVGPGGRAWALVWRGALLSAVHLVLVMTIVAATVLVALLI
jgi:hypothetical protein